MKKKIAIISASIAAVAVIGALVFIGCAKQTPTEEPAPEPEPSGIEVTVECENANEMSSVMFVTTEEGKNIEYTLADNGKAVKIDLEPGDYKVNCIPPVNSDGSIYEACKPIDVTVNEGEYAQVSFKPVPVPADKVTQEQMDKAVDNLCEALSHVKGCTPEEVKKMTAQVAENAKANENVDSESVDEKTEAAANENASNNSGSSNSGSSNNGSNSGSSDNNNGGNHNSGNSGSNDGGSSSTPAPAPEPSKPAHEHSWSAVNKTVHHDAVTESKYVAQYTCMSCGATFSSNSAASNHLKETRHGSYSDSGYYQNVEVSPAWDETVVDHYACSCGATK